MHFILLICYPGSGHPTCGDFRDSSSKDFCCDGCRKTGVLDIQTVVLLLLLQLRGDKMCLNTKVRGFKCYR